PQRADLLGDPREIDGTERPQFARLFGLLAAVGAVEATLRLVAAAVVVHHRHRIDVPADRGLDLGDVIPEAGIAGEDHDRPLRCRAFGAEPGRECPAEVPAAAYVALALVLEIEHAAHPHAGVAGIG